MPVSGSTGIEGGDDLGRNLIATDSFIVKAVARSEAYEITGLEVANGAVTISTLISSFARTFLDDVDAATVRTTIGAGDFVGPSSSTDNAVVRFDGTTGKLGQNSGLIVNDSVVAALSSDGAVVQQGANSSQNYVWNFKSGSFQLVRTNDQSFFHLEPEINQSAAGEYGYTVIKIDVIETSIGLGGNYLADWWVSGISKFSVDRAGIVKISGQIQFPSTQNASSNVNNLDDYEEGTWTVTATAVTSGTVTLDSTLDAGAYTKIGRMVSFTGRVTVDSVSSPVGHLRISLPFTSANLSEDSGRASISVVVTGAVSKNINAFCGLVAEATSYFTLFTSDATSTGVAAAEMQAATTITFGGVYFTD